MRPWTLFAPEATASAEPAAAWVPRAWALPHVGELPERRREVVFGALALAGAGLAIAVPLAGRRLEQPGGFAFLAAWSTLTFVFAGALWWRARPQSPLGPLLTAFGLLVALIGLQGSANDVAFSVGVFLDAPVAFLAWYLIVSFPSGRLDRRGRLLMGLAAGVILFGFLPKMLVSAHVAGATPLARCGPGCPENALLVAPDPGLAEFFSFVEHWGRNAFSLLLVATLVTRYARASRPRRRMVVPVYSVAVAWLVAFTMYNAARDAHAPAAVYEPLGLGVTVARSVLPLGFIAAIVLARAYAGAALQSMVRDLSTNLPVRSVEQIVRRVLDDPSARLAFWLPRGRRYVDPEAHALELPPPDGSASWRPFGRPDGEPIVAIVHDPVLDEDSELVEAAGAATVLALENRRLDSTLRRSVAELRASRKRLVAAVTGERRRMERDLHDGSQQRLLAIRIQLELARERADADPGTLERLAELGDELDGALDELRSVAHGIYPPVLAEEGLPAALTETAGRCGLPVALELARLPRFPEEIEAAAYFSCVEALQNAAKHAGRGARARLRLWTEAGELRFTVSDDGVGFARRDLRRGDGLTNMADRLGALGGTFTISSEPGHGAVVAGAVPLSAATD